MIRGDHCIKNGHICKTDDTPYHRQRIGIHDIEGVMTETDRKYVAARATTPSMRNEYAKRIKTTRERHYALLQARLNAASLANARPSIPILT